MLNIVAFFLIICALGNAFSGVTVSRQVRGSQTLRMAGYLPDGMTQKQWDALQKAEKEKKNKGASGTTKFRSRSFEAWQKSGGKHLFPVDPSTTPYEERPYMQRKDGDWEGKDLQKRGLSGFGQGLAEKKLKLDEVYEEAAAAGKLNSISIFGGMSLPWTNQATEDMNKKVSKDMKQARGVAKKVLSPAEMARLKKNLVKPIVTPKKGDPVVAEAAPRKKLFGLW